MVSISPSIYYAAGLGLLGSFAASTPPPLSSPPFFPSLARGNNNTDVVAVVFFILRRSVWASFITFLWGNGGVYTSLVFGRKKNTTFAFKGAFFFSPTATSLPCTVVVQSDVLFTAKSAMWC